MSKIKRPIVIPWDTSIKPVIQNEEFSENTLVVVWKNKSNYFILPYNKLQNVRYLNGFSKDKLIGLEEQPDNLLVGDYKGKTYNIASTIKLKSNKILTFYKRNDQRVGLRLQFKGRLRGVSKAKVFRKAWGQIKTHTFSNVIDYAEKPLQTKWGIFGLKIFIV